MMRSMYSGVSGLKTHQTKMDVIGNNIANVNTVAFKSNSITFSELMYQTTQKASGANQLTGTGGVNARQIGLGVKSAAINTAIQNQGATQTTGNPFDICINGESFFIVSDGQQNMFTRAGAFNVDSVGNLVMASNGYNVMGWQADDETQLVKKDTVSALRIMSPDKMTYPPEATTAGYVSGILDKRDPQVSSEGGKALSLNFYDALGYQYTAKFGVHSTTEDGQFYVTLDDVFYTDENNKTRSITQDYPGAKLSDIVNIGSLDEAENVKQFNVGITKPLTGGKLTQKAVVGDTSNGYEAVIEYKDGGETKYCHINPGNSTAATKVAPTVTLAGTAPATDSHAEINQTTAVFTRKDIFGSDTPTKDATTGTYTGANADLLAMFKNLYGIEADDLVTYNEVTIDLAGKGELTVASKDVAGAASLKYNIEDGTFQEIKDEYDGSKDGTITLVFKDSFNGESLDKFSNITMDWTATNMFNNNGTSTIGATNGDKDGLNTGRKLGKMSGITVQTNGEIYASYDNGMTRLLGQIAVAEFTNAAGLEKAGENLYKASLNSGEFDGIGVDISASGGYMNTGVLEMSNVDLSAEFTEMITTQRGFQANSRIITVSDTMLEELVNLKR